MGSFGTDAAEKSGSITLSNVPQLNSSSSIESQARFISNFGAVADLTFNERSVRDVSDRGRAKVINEIIAVLSAALKKNRELRRAEQVAADVGKPPCKVQQEVCAQLGLLRRVRATGKPADAPSARIPLQKLDLLPIDAMILKKTKIALELNQDYWKLHSAPEVKRLATKLVQKWRSMYRREEDGPSARTLRNSATEVEESAHALAPRTSLYSDLIEAVLRRLRQPELAAGLVDGRERSFDLVTRIHKRQVLEKKNSGNPAPTQALFKRARLEDDREKLRCLEYKPHTETVAKAVASTSAASAVASVASGVPNEKRSSQSAQVSVTQTRPQLPVVESQSQSHQQQPAAAIARPVDFDDPEGDAWEMEEDDGEINEEDARDATAAAAEPQAMRASAASASAPAAHPRTSFGARLASKSATIVLPM